MSLVGSFCSTTWRMGLVHCAFQLPSSCQHTCLNSDQCSYQPCRWIGYARQAPFPDYIKVWVQETDEFIFSETVSSNNASFPRGPSHLSWSRFSAFNALIWFFFSLSLAFYFWSAWLPGSSEALGRVTRGSLMVFTLNAGRKAYGGDPFRAHRSVWKDS